MLSSIRQYFSPPVFVDDEEKTRAAHIFTTIINAASFINILVIIGSLIGGSSSSNYIFIFTNWAVIIGMQYPVRRGWVKQAGIVLVILLSLVIAAGIAYGGTVLSPAILFLVLVNVIAGLIIGRRAAFWSAALNTLLVFGLVQAEIAGLLPAPDFSVDISQAIIFAAGSLLTAILLNLSFHALEASLERARKNETAMRELASTLEQRVDERSSELAQALRIARLGNWEYNFVTDEFTFNDDFYAMMRTSAEREGGYKMNAAQYAERFVYPEDAPIVGIEIGKSIETTDPNFSTEVDHRVIFGDGKIGYVTVRFRIQKDAEGRTVKSIGANQDITEQKQAEEALRLSESQLAETSRLALMANWEYDLPKDEFTFNDDFYTLMRTTAEQEGGYKMSAAQYAARFVYPEDAALVGVEIGKSIETTDPNFSSQLDHRVIFGDGELGYITVRLRIKKDDQGRTIASYGANQDITERKKAETELRKFQLALERSTDAVFMTDLQGVIEYANPAFEKTYGYSVEETIGSTPRIIKSGLIPQEQYEHFWSVLQNDQVIAGEIVNKHKDGRLLPVEAMNTSILDVNGNRLGYMATHRDITARKQVEEALAKRAAELETVTQVATAISTIQNPQEMLQFVSDLTKERFNFYHAHVYLLDDVDGLLELAAGAGEAGQKMVAQRHAIPLAQEKSLVARAARTRQGVTVNDVTLAPDFLPNPLLPETRSELAVPMLIRDQVLGVLDVQSKQVNAFSEEDIRTQVILAAQIAVALENARAREQTVKTVAELDELTRRLTREGWNTYLTETENPRMGYLYEADQLTPLEENGQLTQETEKTFTQPVQIRGETIGHLFTTEAEIEESELKQILAGVSQGLSAHLENLRLTEEAERRVNELDVINDIGQILASEVELLPILVTVVNKLNQTFNANTVYIALYDPEREMIEIPFMLDHGDPNFDEPPFPFGEGINSTILKTRQTVFLNQDAERHLLDLGALPTTHSDKMAKSFIGVPLITGDNALGVMSIQDTERSGRFTQSDVTLLTTVAANVAIAIRNVQLFTQTRKRAERETMVNLISQKIQSATTVQGALQTAIQELGVALKARRTLVELGTKHGKEVES